MISIKLGQSDVADAFVEFALSKKAKSADSVLSDLQKELSKKSSNLQKAKEFGFENASAGMFFVQESKTLLVVIDSLDCDSVRESGANVIRYFKKLSFKSIGLKAFNEEELDYALMLGIYAGDYENNMYKSDNKKTELEKFIIEAKDSKNAESSNKYAKIVAKSLKIARDLVNTMPQVATPAYIYDVAKELATKNELEFVALDKKAMKKEKMDAFLSVARASVNEPYLLHLSYKPKNAKKRLVLVGKGLTYDSGGLSLKPADYMTTMKADKSGACAVLGIMNAIAQIAPSVEVHGIMGMAENMIGGNAYKPDDVLYSREGKTIEVRNTDAEGRLVLADCLSYAQDLKPDILIDFATLTGACVVALGEYTSGIMGYNEELKIAFENAALKSGELAARLPFNRHIRKLIDSKIADVCNVSSSRYGGAISAGMFLGEFIRDEFRQKWLHIDIAGPAYIEKEWDINAFGASGAGIRATLEFIKSYIN